MTEFQQKFLPPLLVISGIAFLGVKLMMILFPSAWGWSPAQPEYEGMIVGVYAVLGIFMFIAARDPMAHLSLIWFTAISTLVHGVIMLFQAISDPTEADNLVGDVPALIVLGIILIVVTPKKLKAD